MEPEFAELARDGINRDFTPEIIDDALSQQVKAHAATRQFIDRFSRTKSGLKDQEHRLTIVERGEFFGRQETEPFGPGPDFFRIQPSTIVSENQRHAARRCLVIGVQTEGDRSRRRFPGGSPFRGRFQSVSQTIAA